MCESHRSLARGGGREVTVSTPPPPTPMRRPGSRERGRRIGSPRTPKEKPQIEVVEHSGRRLGSIGERGIANMPVGAVPVETPQGDDSLEIIDITPEKITEDTLDRISDVLMAAQKAESQYRGKGPKKKAKRKEWQNGVIRDLSSALNDAGFSGGDLSLLESNRRDLVVSIRYKLVRALDSAFGSGSAEEIMPDFIKTAH